MIQRFRLIRNVGCFDSFEGSADTEFGPLTLVYAENARGKTTLVAILRSLATGNSAWITGRRRLGAQHPPHVVVKVDGQPQPIVFEDDQWSSSYHSIAIFDDQFVDDNVYSGLSVTPDHRQNLHEVILGSRGVALARRVDELTERIAHLNQQIREKEAAIPKEARHGLDVDSFCDLKLPDQIDTRIEGLHKKAQAIKQADRVRSTRLFSQIDFPRIELPGVAGLLRRQLPDLDKEAVARVHAHLDLLGEESERWVSEGVSRIIQVEPPRTEERCPFCGQGVSGIDLLQKYHAYFGDAYRSLQTGIDQTIARYEATLGGDALAQCQRAIGRLEEQYRFWSGFTTLPSLDVDQEAFASAWSAARDALTALFSAKRSAPLEPIELPDDARKKVAEFGRQIGGVRVQVGALLAVNPTITELKESATSGHAALIDEDLRRLNAAKARYCDEVKPLCDAYVSVRQQKHKAEQEKKQARKALDTHRRQAFPAYRTAVNRYLERFGATFRIEGVQAHDAAGRPSAAYHLTIRDTEVPLVAKGNGSEPSFKNTVSSGDRNTLALSFFFTAMELDGDIGAKVVVIDDPVSSLDEGRVMTTMSEVRRLTERAKQVIVLSHSKPFLCRMFKHADVDTVACLSLGRCPDNASLLSVWQPTEDELTAYDQRHKLLREFRDGHAPDIRQVAQSLRPVIEGYLRVAFPEHCAPGTLLGQFRQRIQARIDAGDQVMETVRLLELEEIADYANKFHHDTNPAWETERVNDTELLGFVGRVLDFISH